MIAADTCECLGDMTPEQSLTVLEMMCWEDQYLMQNYKFYNHTDVEKIGLVLIASKTRCDFFQLAQVKTICGGKCLNFWCREQRSIFEYYCMYCMITDNSQQKHKQ